MGILRYRWRHLIGWVSLLVVCSLSLRVFSKDIGNHDIPTPSNPLPYESLPLPVIGTGEDVVGGGLNECTYGPYASPWSHRSRWLCTSSTSGEFEGILYSELQVELGIQGYRMADGSWNVPDAREVRFNDLVYSNLVFIPVIQVVPERSDHRVDYFDLTLGERGWFRDDGGSDSYFPRRYIKPGYQYGIGLNLQRGFIALSVFPMKVPVDAIYQALLENSPERVNIVKEYQAARLRGVGGN